MVIGFINYEDKNCPYCNKKTNTTSAYTFHIRRCKCNPDSNWYRQNRLKKTCPKCGLEFVSNTKEQMYCSRKCANSHVVSEEHKKKTSQTIRNKYKDVKKEEFFCSKCGKQLKKKTKTGLCIQCLKSYYPDYIRKKISQSNKGKERWHIHRNQSSYAEKFWEQVLNNNNIFYEREYAVKHGNIHCYFLDFLICKNGYRLDLEIDGKQHNERRDLDQIRDEFLIKNGFIVYRIDWNSIRSKRGSMIMKDKIDKFLCFYNSL